MSMQPTYFSNHFKMSIVYIGWKLQVFRRRKELKKDSHFLLIYLKKKKKLNNYIKYPKTWVSCKIVP